jgi:hypothetical protein
MLWGWTACWNCGQGNTKLYWYKACWARYFKSELVVITVVWHLTVI